MSFLPLEYLGLRECGFNGTGQKMSFRRRSTAKTQSWHGTENTFECAIVAFELVCLPAPQLFLLAHGRAGRPIRDDVFTGDAPRVTTQVVDYHW